MLKTPYKNKKYVISFCRKVCIGSKSMYVIVEPLPNKPVNECFSIVPEHVASHRGKQKFGWAIYHWPRVFIEAEFHCVWERPDGVLIDITPKAFHFDKILFLPDPHRHYEGFQVDNIRKAISNDPLVKSFIDLAAERFREMNKGDLAYQHGDINISERCKGIECEMEKINLALVMKFGWP